MHFKSRRNDIERSEHSPRDLRGDLVAVLQNVLAFLLKLISASLLNVNDMYMGIASVISTNFLHSFPDIWDGCGPYFRVDCLHGRRNREHSGPEYRFIIQLHHHWGSGISCRNCSGSNKKVN